METLEPRQLLTVIPGIPGQPFEDFGGNYHPPQRAEFGTIDYLSAPATGNPVSIATNYLSQNAGLYGLSAGDIANMKVAGQSTDSRTGASHIYFSQSYNNMPVADVAASVNLTKNGRVVSAAANFVGGLSYPTGAIPLAPTVNRGTALSAFGAAADLTPTGSIQIVSAPTGNTQKGTFKQAGLFANTFTMQLQYVPKPGGGLELAWNIIGESADHAHFYDVSVAAAGNRAGQVIRMGDQVWSDFYNVLPQEPVAVQDPTFGSPAIVVNPADFIASPFGWHDINGIPGADFIDTSGNNVQAQTDINGDNAFSTPDVRPVDVNLQFNPTTDFTMPAAFNQEAGVLNAFYWSNLSHDVLARHGFDEPSGNMQFRNYSGTTPFNGVALDQLQVDTRDPLASLALLGPHIFVTPDGISPRMQLGDNIFVTPSRDSAFDATIVAHEYFHAVSTRLTGGSQSVAELNALQSAGMGEGWSDWFGILMTMKPSDDQNTPRTSGNWFLGGLIGGVGGGVREFPYSFDMTINPHVLSDYNRIPDPTLPFPSNNGGSEPHNSGEIWASALWDMTWLLINRYGSDLDFTPGAGGQSKALDLVIEGLKLQPVNPSFLDARDAIIAADFQLNGGENFDIIWQAFARRGFGVSANVGIGSNSTVVAEAFDLPVPLGRVEGTVFNDSNGNAKRDANEIGIAGVTVYADINNNAVLDPAIEKQAQTDGNGGYHFVFTTNQTVTVRQILPADFKQTFPKNNAGTTFFVTRGNTFTADFGDQGLPGEVSGLKWNDLNANGVRDLDALGALEPGLAGVVIYADLNNDQRLNVLEPSTITGPNGRYVLKLPAGTYSIREVLGAGLTQTFPDPTGVSGFGYTNVIVGSSQVITSLDFGNIASLDWGDAPASYGTLLAGNGPRHGILPGFSLGALIDPESDGQPNADATGDDAATSDDEDGVNFGNAAGSLPSISPGLPKNIQVTINTGANSAGKLQGWVDFNRDGDFADAGEKVFSNLTLGTGTHSLTIPARTAGIVTGLTFARFRYAYETDLGPTAAAQAGEVEDYALNILPNTPTAVDDGPFNVRQGTDFTDNVFNVVANDPTTSFGPPVIIAGDFPITIPGTGSQVRLAGNQLEYRPGPSVLGPESFTYRVTDGNSISLPGVVRVNVAVRDPRAIDDVYTIQSQTEANPVVLGPGVPLILSNNQFVTDNDLTAHPWPDTRIIAVTTLTPGVPITTFSISTGANGERTLVFNPPSNNFTGTVVGQYTITDDVNNADTGTVTTSQARVTVQVVSSLSTPAASHRARMDVEILSLNPATGAYEPDTSVEAGSLFLVRVTAQDLRSNVTDPTLNPGTNQNRGVEAAYLDLDVILTNPGNLADPDDRSPGFFASPVISVGHPRGMHVVFDGTPSGVTGTVEAGATATSFGGGPGLSDVDNFFTNQNVVFTSGALRGQMGQVISYDGATHTFTFGTNTFTAAPAAGDTFRLDIPRYLVQQLGTPNAPAQGDVDEGGATHVDATGAPVGLGTVTVFSVLMRANAATPPGQALQIVGDPADQDPQTRVILSGDTTDPLNIIDPERINNNDDGKVYYDPSAPLTITGGSAEFTNPTNQFDVNGDSDVSPLDALLIINELNNNGSQSLASSRVTASSTPATRTYFDVNKDSEIAPIDALLVINFLNGLKTTATSGAGGEGEAEGEDVATSASVADTDEVAAALSAEAADAVFTDLFRGRRRAR